MANYIYVALFGLIHLCSLLQLIFIKLIKATNGIALPSRVLEWVFVRCFGMLYALTNWGFHYRRNCLALLIRQNDPLFQENIKLFLGEIFELDNSSDNIDLRKLMHSDFNRWRGMASKAVQRLMWRSKVTTDGRHKRFLERLKSERLHALMLKFRVKVSSVEHFTISYIYHNGGLADR